MPQVSGVPVHLSSMRPGDSSSGLYNDCKEGKADGPDKGNQISREMAQTSGFDPTFKVKICFDCKMIDVANWVACLNGENGPGGTPSHEALSVSPQGALEIASSTGQPPSLVRDLFSSPRVVAKS